MATLRVKEAFFEFSLARPELYEVGRPVDSDDPVVKGRESKFEPMEEAVRRQRERQSGALVRAEGIIEQATAEPGAKRLRSKLAVKKDAEKDAD